MLCLILSLTSINLASCITNNNHNNNDNTQISSPSPSSSPNEIAEVRPQNVDDVYSKIEVGRGQLRSKNFQLARLSFEEAQKLDKEHPLPYFYLGVTLDQEAKIDEADGYYEIAKNKYLQSRQKGYQLRSQDYDALVEMCHVLNKDRGYKDSHDLSLLALAIQGISPAKKYAAYACQGTALFWLDRSETDRKSAESSFIEALSIKQSHLVYYNLGSLYASRMKDYEKAEDAYRRSLNLQEDFVPAKRDLGFTYILAGKLEKAKQMLELVKKDSSAEAGLRVIDTLKTSPQSASALSLSISSLNVFGNFTVHDFEQDSLLKDPHDHDHEK